MYDFHYNYIKSKYDERGKLFTDTDSLCYEIKTEGFYGDITEDIENRVPKRSPIRHQSR